LLAAARISLDDMRMQIESKWAELAPGMAVTVEIRTGQRRIAAYLLSPLLRVNRTPPVKAPLAAGRGCES
jgi:hemolysin D